MIAEQGYDALSTRALAKAASVSQPTLYNLIGSKEEIVRALLLETTARIEEHVSTLSAEDPIRWVDAVWEKLTEIIDEDETYYRAAVIAGDRNPDLFAAMESEGDALPLIGAKATALYRRLCEALIASGQLRGRLPAADVSAALYASFLGALRDWAYGSVSLAEAERRTRSAHLIVLAADAAPGLRDRLLQRHEALAPG